MLAKCCWEDHGNDAGHVGYNGGLHHLYARLCDRSGTACVKAIYKDTHKDCSAHQSGAHHKRRTCMTVDHLLLKLDRCIVYKKSCRHTEHEREIAWELIPYKHSDNCDGQADIESEKLRSRILILVLLMLYFFCSVLRSCFHCKLSVQTCASLFLLNTCKHRMCQAENDSKDLDRDQTAPELSCLHTENRCCAHGRTGPWHQV